MANNIDQELETIRTGRYGSDIRMAIHDAINKLNEAANDINEHPEKYTPAGAVGIVEFDPSISGVSLYDEELDEDGLLSLRYQFWHSMEGDFLPEGYFAEYAFGFIDETGTLIDDKTGFAINTEPGTVVMNALGNGCGVFFVYGAEGIQNSKKIGHLQAENNEWYIGYKAKHGIMIIIRDMSVEDQEMNSGVVIIGKTNNGDICYLGQTASNLRHASALNANVAAENDDFFARSVTFTFMPETETDYANVRTGQVGQTILCPIPTHNDDGKISYMEGIYAMPWSQFRGRDGAFVMNGKRYITNGYYAILDE